MDILPPPKRPRLTVPPRTKSAPAQAPDSSTPAIPASEPDKPTVPPTDQTPRLGPPWYRRWQLLILGGLGVFVVLALGSLGWYGWSLLPTDTADTQKVRVVVETGATSADIVNTLADKGLIRSRLATRIYINLSGRRQHLQAGGYVLSKQQSVGEIVDHIASGKTDEINVTILPGLTLKDLADPEVKGSLAQQGFSAEEIKAAFAAEYNSPLLADRPQGQGLEGYIFPETYRMHAGDKLDTVIQRSLNELTARLQAAGMFDKFKARNLTTYQALTLASIVQKEVSDPQTQRQVVQVFYARLAQNMPLGSDVTFEYAAAQLGVTPAVDIASPYNTRQNTGLPPGPIANMNFSSLQAIVDPLPGDFLYFVAGDDGRTYFARTMAEHEANVAAHCHDLCNLY